MPRSTEQQQLALLLKELRHMASLSQAGVAKRLGQRQSYVSAIETGKRNLDLLQIKELCNVYGWSMTRFAEELERRLANRSR